MRCVDVNVLVYAHREDVAEHQLHRTWLDLARRGPEPLGIPTVVASGFLRIVTHPRVFELPTPLEEALTFLDVVLRSPAVVSLAPGPGHWTAFTDLCRRIGARGNQVPDAYLAAFALEQGASFVSADRGFAGYPSLRWVHPADAPT
ncbi:MAG: type II toxin-antitoxin system VapC family toxin [Acidimicrobiales bacterium]|nr:type II toxin-antitoxin system VapC family toxin [Acidimicrobiales bacterium]HRW39391.1 type II toxin-antitoxin system VapC family toxin [Aquihabitans sp.]